MPLQRGQRSSIRISLDPYLRSTIRFPTEEKAFTARPKIHSHSQIFRYGHSILCLQHRPNFSDIFDLCLHWVSVVRGCGGSLHFRVYKSDQTYRKFDLFWNREGTSWQKWVLNQHSHYDAHGMNWPQLFFNYFDVMEKSKIFGDIVGRNIFSNTTAECFWTHTSLTI